jgi:spore germination cell wall hydrolase CwlJ-like protein
MRPLLLLLALAAVPLLARAHPAPLDPWERQIVAACLVLEAACQGEAGMAAVMNVIANRASGDPARFAAVTRRPYQFSAFNPATVRGERSLADLVQRASRDRTWGLALALVDRAAAGALPDLTDGATHFSRVEEQARWMGRMEVTAVIGSHKFLR